MPPTAWALCHLLHRSQAFELGAEEMHLQAWGASSSALTTCALELANIDPERVVVKLPCTVEGMAAASMLCKNKARVNLTVRARQPNVG
jgi:transaldolase